MNRRRVRSSLVVAYSRAEYCVILPRGELIMRVDRRSGANDGRLRREAGVRRSWAIVTACNPGSVQFHAATNAGRLELLEAAVADSGLEGVPSVNRDPSRLWPDEPGILLCDPAPGQAEAIGRQFGQSAIVAGVLGKAPQLVWL